MKKNKKNVLKMVLVGVGVLGLTGATIGIIKNLNHDHEDVEKAKSIDLNTENITFSKINESKYVFATLENKEVGDKILWKTSSSKISLTPSNDSYSCNLVLNDELNSVVIITAYLSGNEDVYKNIYCTYNASVNTFDKAPEITLNKESTSSLGLFIRNNNGVACDFIGTWTDNLGNTGNVKAGVGVQNYTTISINWVGEASSLTLSGYFKADGYENSDLSEYSRDRVEEHVHTYVEKTKVCGGAKHQTTKACGGSCNLKIEYKCVQCSASASNKDDVVHTSGCTGTIATYTSYICSKCGKVYATAQSGGCSAQETIYRCGSCNAEYSDGAGGCTAFIKYEECSGCGDIKDSE